VGFFSSKTLITNESVYLLLVDQIGLMHHFFIDVQKESFTKDTIEGVKLYGAFPYHCKFKMNQTLDESNLKINKEQKEILRQAISLVRESLWESEMNEIKKCVKKFSDYWKKANGLLVDKTFLFKDPAFNVFKKKLAEKDILFVN